MSEFNIESEAIDVERIMGQIRARIKEKRGEDYTEEQIRELAHVKLERFLDPKNVRSGMVEFYQKRLKEKEAALKASPPAPPSFEFDPDIIYRSSRGFSGQMLYRIRKLLSPVLKFFFNPAPIVHALTIQQEINERQAEVISQMVRTQAEFIEIAALNYEVMNNLVVEMTRLSIEMKNHKMRVESVAGRLDFDERRARALEKVVQDRGGSPAPEGSAADGTPEKRRRRRRRGRRKPTAAASTETTADRAESPPRESSGSESAVPTSADSPGPAPDAPPSSPAAEQPPSQATPSPQADASAPAQPASPSPREADVPPERQTSSSGDGDPSER